MNPGDFEYLRGFLEQKAGLIISQDKSFLLESRLSPVARQWKCQDVSGLVILLRGLPNQKLVRDLIDAATLHDTSFWRETRQFRALEHHILPDLIRAHERAKTLRVWSAACGSGQEPYMLAMLLREKGLIDKGWKIEIVASDVNEAQLERAARCVYSQFEVQRGLPIRYLVRYFDKLGGVWKLKDDIRKMVKLQSFNLLSDMSALGAFDLILCRHMLAHCSARAQADILARLTGQLGAQGFLMTGADELTDMTPHWRASGDLPGTYVKTA